MKGIEDLSIKVEFREEFKEALLKRIEEENQREITAENLDNYLTENDKFNPDDLDISVLNGNKIQTENGELTKSEQDVINMIAMMQRNSLESAKRYGNEELQRAYDKHYSSPIEAEKAAINRGRCDQFKEYLVNLLEDNEIYCKSLSNLEGEEISLGESINGVLKISKEKPQNTLAQDFALERQVSKEMDKKSAHDDIMREVVLDTVAAEKSNKMALEALEGKELTEEREIILSDFESSRKQYESLWDTLEKQEKIDSVALSGNKNMYENLVSNFDNIFKNSNATNEFINEDFEIRDAEGAKDIRLGVTDYCMVDGKPLKEFAKDYYDKADFNSPAGQKMEEDLQKAIFVGALTSGKHKVEMANVLMGPDGEKKVGHFAELKPMLQFAPDIEKSRVENKLDTAEAGREIAQNVDDRRKKLGNGLEFEELTVALQPQPEELKEVLDGFKKADSMFHRDSKEFKNMKMAIEKLEKRQREIEEKRVREERTAYNMDEERELKGLYKNVKDSCDKYMEGKTENQKTSMGRERYKWASRARDIAENMEKTMDSFEKKVRGISNEEVPQEPRQRMSVDLKGGAYENDGQAKAQANPGKNKTANKVPAQKGKN